MEQLENRILIEELYPEPTDWDRYYERMAEKEDKEWEDDLDD